MFPVSIPWLRVPANKAATESRVRSSIFKVVISKGFAIMTWLTVTEWQCQRWPRMCPNCHCHNFALLSSFMTHYQMTYHRIVNVSSTTGATSGGRIGFRNCSNSVLFLFFIYFLFYIPVSPVTCMANCSHAYSLHGYSWNTAHVISLSFNLLRGICVLIDIMISITVFSYKTVFVSWRVSLFE